MIWRIFFNSTEFSDYFYYESINFVACVIIRRSSRLIDDSDFETLQIIAKDLTKFNSSWKIEFKIGLPLSFFMNK